ncbi:glyoxylase-like metal-dependent hydrolase (beta-lactamase superfamily II) [Motilibacter peucedani]|uniref:Glyoxylase-like metal-dependent hydrolase (Beta-lactamase superfamily II) n=1 Tax=Motilibacter peucedani TaxID=598650 RepID=A0A420XR60_9ACTN|nr:MBL fold metallo-hydrolase [Motilibacter peucedani]RKS75714.1 glyoxylase-like metal-dependent hydrolase (beta-lactamase superfamily II) [Motilibacter peucedani]
MLDVLPVVMPLRLPPGMAGPAGVELDVRAYLVASEDRVVLVDTGMDPSAEGVAAGLVELGAAWAEVSDVVVTHYHPDHTGGLARVRAQAPQARVWSGDELPDARRVGDGDRVGPLRVMATPGHTPGHVSFVDERSGDVLVGDCVGSVGGRLERAPAPFTADAHVAERSLLRLVEQGGRRLLLGHGAEVADPWEALTALVTAGPPAR